MEAFREATILEFGSCLLRRIFHRPPDTPVVLAGGAFKSLIHDRPPRDLDLWVLEESDHRVVCRSLLEQGALLVRDNPSYQTAFRIQDRLVEVAYPVADRRTVDDLLDHFDIGLSAVAVCWRDGRFRPFLRPEAVESVRRRKVLLIWPLRNWKYALCTLERMRRYARELEFTVPAEEAENLWSIFAAQDAPEQERMIERYLRVGKGDREILEEARRRLHGVAA